MRIIFLILGLVCSLSAVAQQVTFRFAPPDGTVILQETTNQISELNVVTHEIQKESRDSKNEIRIRKTPEGYEIDTTCSDFKSFINGQAWTNPLQSVLVGMNTKLVVSTNGSVLSVSGGEEVLTKAKKVLPLKLHPLLDRDLNPKISEEREKWIWLQTYGVMNGKTVSRGAWFTNTFHSPRANDDPLHMVYFVSEITNINNHLAVRVQYFGSTDSSEIEPEGLKKAYLNQMTEFFKLKSKKMPLIRTAGSRWYNPETLLLLQEEKLDQDLSSGSRKIDFSTSKFNINGHEAINVQQ